MNVTIPPALSPMAPVLSEFFEAMVHKLNVNSHKNAISSDDIDGLLDKLAAEIQEFRDQRIQDASDPNILMELADSSNFCFLLFAYLRSRGVWDLRERFIAEFYDVDPVNGVIRCKKTRAGSPMVVGQQVRGTTRGGVVMIRTQHSASGATISLPRRNIVWWWSTGKWPERALQYKDRLDPKRTLGDHDRRDRIDNLELVPEKSEVKFPFVTQYKPKGRENTTNYGKWVYQRRHALKLVRVGYWDTAEEAAHEGLKAWKEKTRV